MNTEENQNSGTNKAPVDLNISTTKVIAIGSLTDKVISPAERSDVMLKEVPATVLLYLDGKIESWFAKSDQTGVIFIMNVTTTKEAHELLVNLPLGKIGMMTFELIPVGPLSPLRFLLN